MTEVFCLCYFVSILYFHGFTYIEMIIDFTIFGFDNAWLYTVYSCTLVSSGSGFISGTSLFHGTGIGSLYLLRFEFMVLLGTVLLKDLHKT